MTVRNKWTGERVEVVSSWITERLDLSFVTILDRTSFSKPVQEEWDLTDIDGGAEAYFEHGLDCMDHIAERSAS